MCAVGLLTACSSDDLPLTKSDEATFITFGATMENILTRAAATPERHEAWKITDPQSMKVFGWVGAEQKMKGVRVDYNAGEWAYNPPQYWADYLTNEDYAFVACMPYSAGITGEYAGGRYSVSMPVSISSGFYTDANKANFPLISHLNYNPQVGEVVGFHMDQTLTAFKLEFALGDKMSKLRYFKIKNVWISGTMATSGTVTCSFASNSTGCIQSNSNVNLSWSDITTADKSEVPLEGTAIDVKSESFLAWKNGENPVTLYVIPSAEFNPTIKVKYDVYENYEGKDVITRKDVVSTIVFKQANFPEYTSAAAIGKINPIKIKIVPDYLYVLADDDQTQGYLVLQ